MFLEIYRKEKHCRICSSSNLELILDLGKQPPANSFITKRNIRLKEQKFPLRLFFCKDCYLLQLLDIVNKKVLFKHYLYLTGASKPIVQHFSKYASEIFHNYLKKKNDPYVVEIGSNDGSLLKEFKKFRISVLGIEPATNVTKIANKHNIKTINSFFSLALAKKLAKERKATLIVANNVVAHVENLNDLMKGVKHLLLEDGIFVFEVPYLLDLIKNTEFDTVYHEHLSYFSLIPLSKLVKQFGLEIFNIKKTKVHGGTIRVFVCRENTYKKRAIVDKIIQNEKKVGMMKLVTYKKFANNVKLLKKQILKELNRLKSNKKIIFGYGASAKGNVLLNYCGIDTKILDFIIDTTPLKHGLYSPGTHIPIIPSKKISKFGDNSVALMLAWNYKENILKKEEKFRDRGGKFFVPIPKPRLL